MEHVAILSETDLYLTIKPYIDEYQIRTLLAPLVDTLVTFYSKLRLKTKSVKNFSAESL